MYLRDDSIRDLCNRDMHLFPAHARDTCPKTAMLHVARRRNRLNRPLAVAWNVDLRHFGRKARGGILVVDPVMAWGSTATMGPKDLLDAIDRASRAGARLDEKTGRLWERLSCRCQALMLALSPPQLSRALFGFHRARYTGSELLSAAGEALLSERDWEGDEGDEADVHQLGRHVAMSANDVAMLLKAFSKHRYAENSAMDLLLHRREYCGVCSTHPVGKTWNDSNLQVFFGFAKILYK